jgi:hypothetical protein
MSDKTVTVIFLTPQEEEFTGTLHEITTELYRRSLVFGTCAYKMKYNVLYLVDVSENEDE